MNIFKIGEPMNEKEYDLFDIINQLKCILNNHKPIPEDLLTIYNKLINE